MEKQQAPTLFPIGLYPGNAISPVDGRYREKTEALAPYFSESGLMKYRLLVSVEYFIALSDMAKIIRPLGKAELRFLRSLYRFFSDDDYAAIKEIEKTANHDVNAVVRFLKKRLENHKTLYVLSEFVHFGLTSEDINNLAYAFQLRGGLTLLATGYEAVMAELLSELVKPHAWTSMLAHTHGQPASPTTVGWEAHVFYHRLYPIYKELMRMSILVKFGGATGGHNALNIAYPEIDWRNFSKKFIARINRIHDSNLKLLPFVCNPYTTQVEPHDTYGCLFDTIKRANTVLIDLCRDVWTYISMDYFKQKPNPEEDGSSAMPNKVNPIDFENAEGNFGLANMFCEFFSHDLPLSRMQRHLTDSTIIRNFGTAFSHTVIALAAVEKGLGKIYVNSEDLLFFLNNNWSVVAEAYQTILRKYGVTKSYDLLKKATRGKEVDRKTMMVFAGQVVKENGLPESVYEELLAVTPMNYIGDRTTPFSGKKP